MSEIVAAIDEGAAQQLFDFEVASLGTMATSGASSLGPFAVTYAVTGMLSNGTIDLIAPGTVRVADLRLDWHIDLSFQLDIGDFIPDIHIPQICVHIPCVGDVCTPKIDIVWPTVSVPVSFGDFVKTTVDLGVAISLVAAIWKVEGVVQGVPNLQFGVATAALLTAIGLAVAAAVGWVPLIGPFVAVLVAAVLAAVGIAGLTGLLGPILTPFISGTRFPITEVPAHFQVLPSAGPFDPAVFVTVDSLGAEVQHNPPEDELVVLADISA
ncbi:hypothetical protein [Nocardioides sp.]|uniref:hypothetical protein n=1 Tax=Nocardioides sp. TaxID=35761 RepID=UPI00352759E9